MKYCNGSCRKKHNKINDLNSCPYYKTYTVDKESNNSKVHEICSKKPTFIILLWKIFFPDLINLNDYNMGSRESNTVLFNRESFLKNRDLQ